MPKIGWFEKVVEGEDKINRIVDSLGLGSIGIICFLYSLLWSNFAETHITLPFLDFPIFIGEILLFLCVILLLLKWKAAHFKFNSKYWFLLLYSVWVLFRALHGYFQWGPLALRNAALFYYPFFAFAGYHFYRKDLFNQNIIYALFFILVITKIAAGTSFMYYFSTPYLMLSVFLILKMRIKKMRYFAFAVLIYSFPFKAFFQGSRSFLVANLIVMLFLFLVYFWGWIRVRKATKLLGLTLVFLILIFIFFKFAPSEKVKSLTTPHYIIEQFRSYDEMIQKNKKDFVPREIPVQIYNPNKNQIKWDNIDEQEKIGHEIRTKVNNMMKEIDAGVDQDGLEPVGANEPEMESVREESRYFQMFQEQKDRIRREVFALDEIDQRKMMYFDEEFGSAVNEAVENLVVGKEVIDGVRRGRGMQTEYGNILFRVLIWREMVEEMIQEKKWFGFSFGKPQRSIALESSDFAVGEWGRDGWIAPHNAFLHIVYRAGIIGFFLIFSICVALFFITREVITRRSSDGPLLVAVLIYWIVLSSFLVVLELPYQAIPFWTLFGMIFAYFLKEFGIDGQEKGMP